MRRKILTVSAVLAVVLFAGCGGSDKLTRSMETTTLGNSVGLSTKSVSTQQIPTVSTKSTLQTGTEFTIVKDIQKDTVVGKVESDKFAGEILNLSLCGDYANYFSIDENGTLKLECDLPEDFEEATLKVEAAVKKDGICKNVSLHVKISVQKFDLTKGLVSYYKFDGNTKDSSGNGNDGIEDGTISYVDGIVYKAFTSTEFDSLKIQNSLKKETFSIALWCKINVDHNQTYGNTGISVWYNSSDYTKQSFGFTPSSGNHVAYLKNEYPELAVRNNNPNTINAGSFYYGKDQIKSNQWELIVITYNNKNINVYLNNKVIIQNKITNNSPVGRDLKITAKNGDSIDNLRIYNRVISEDEIKELYKTKQ